MGRLNDKVAIITGGASGIGEMMTKRFQQEGATVIAADINEEALKKVSQDNIHGMKLDVASENSWQSLLEKVMDQFGKIDILVNNAGITSEKPVAEIDYTDWEKLSKVNGFGAFLGLKRSEERRVGKEWRSGRWKEE